jgi:hypothetical protein
MARSRSDWNSRFEHWQRPASDSEEQKIERAARMVRDALAKNAWLVAEGVSVYAQGSYHYNTNVRLDSDMDLRVVHPGIKVQYHPNVHLESANQILGYTFNGPSPSSLNSRMRLEMAAVLSSEFGFRNVDDTGNRAIHVKSLPGSRAEVDVVPTFVLHHVMWIDATQNYCTTQGVGILSKDASTWTFNFPQQHNENGIAKRGRTKHRFKRCVRILKRLRNEMAELGFLAAGPIPSYLIECLAYRVEDAFYLDEADDHFNRICWVVRRLQELAADPNWVAQATEINDVKRLFGSWQGWTLTQVIAFLAAALNYLEE